jgi:hypothetical protein
MSAPRFFAPIFALCLALSAPAALCAQDAPPAAAQPAQPAAAQFVAQPVAAQPAAAQPVAQPAAAQPAAAQPAAAQPAQPAAAQPAQPAAAQPAQPAAAQPAQPAAAQPVAQPVAATDRVTFGEDVVVREGERVRDVVTFGGDATIDGEVLGSVVTMGGAATVRGHVAGDVVTMGGNADIASSAVVDGEVITMGGELDAAPGASTGAVVTMGESEVAGLAALGTLGGLAAFVHEALAGAASFALLFLLGLLMQGAARERLDALQLVVAREPLHAALLGAAGFLGAVVATVVLTITLVGIPVAIALAIALYLACYVGLATVASVLGALLPIPQLHERPLMQLGAGVLTLYLASLVPGVGTLALMVAGALGLGAVIRTRLRTTAPPSLPGTPAGPDRTSTYPASV